ncbi:MAG: hypothetical protein EP348_03935 [Alphaproteobacteria bacterium]|nr:MAG: hypothetical protein EP348_03935 [Alphaproteobacteria bacterium]
MKRLLLVSAFGLMMTMTPAIAQSQSEDGAGQMAIEGVAKLMSALRAFISSIPQYEAPEMLPNGDIVIRRKNPEPEEAPKEKGGPKLEKTQT